MSATEDPRLLRAEVRGTPMAALVAHADRPRGVVLALHGGGASKEYFDAPLDPALSLLRLGPALGFTVVAPDRPGYLAGDGAGELSAAARTDLLYGVLDAALGGHDRGAGVLLLGHSMGSLSAIRMAAAARGDELLGVDFSGTGLRRSPAVAASLAPGETFPSRAALGRLIWGPPELYPPGTRDLARTVIGPPSEGTDSSGWSSELPELAARIAVPVRYSLADHESWWMPGEQALAEMAALFTAAPLVQTVIETSAGHNLSLGRTARAYHLRVLAFAEQCLAAQLPTPPTTAVPAEPADEERKPR